MIFLHRYFSDLKLVSKITLLVALLGTLALTITVYSMVNMRKVDLDYRNLINKDAAATLLISSALLNLSDASRMVFAVLTEQEEQKMRDTHKDLDALQLQFREKIEEIRPLLEETDADIIIFNNELSPSQIKNLERELDREILDRTSLILEIFAKRAKTRDSA